MPMCIFARKQPIVTEECCLGYTGTNCDIPKCDKDCLNGGTCLSLVEGCKCPTGFDGRALITSTKKFCYKGHKCNFGRAKGFEVNVTEYSDCCQNGGVSWGQSGDCQLCSDSSNQTGVIEKIKKLNFATCASYGKTNYRSFDGLTYQFGGNCKYTMVAPPNDLWYCKMRLKDAEHASRLTKEIECKFDEVNIWVMQEDSIKYGPSRNNLQSVTGITITNGFAESGVIIEKLGDFYRLESEIRGIRIKWTKDTAYFTVEKGIHHEGNLKGLCGDYNSNPSDDMAGFSNPAQFGNSYKEPGCLNAGTVGFTCESDADEREAEMKCLPIKTKIFSACQSAVDLEMWFKNCVNDYCSALADVDYPEGKTAVICTTFGALARECAASSSGTIQISWRKADLCPRQCPDGMEYSEHMPSCPRTCANLYQIMSSDCISNVVPGCRCKTGTFLSEGNCTAAEKCPCYYQKKKYESGEFVMNECNKCSCNAGRWSCTKKRCPKKCKILNDHVFPFSGNSYTMKGGDCEFVAIEIILQSSCIIIS
ncbi:mucin-2-like [Tubulanus polymorphus]|uniref:mucin-2-like n=1 Tax=Tubulanus polymorphus TaxID=672921 RepID=UPI003DA48ECE